MSMLRDDLWPLALHESGHVLASFFAGHLIEKVYVGRPQGYVQVVYHLTCESLATRWAESPIAASGNLMRIVGAIRSGALFEGAADLYGDDLASMAQWRDAYVAGVGTSQDWVILYAEVYSALLSWRQRASVQATVKTLAKGLLYEGTVGKDALTSLLALAGVQHVPEPYYRPVLPSPQRTPAPVVSAPVPRRVTGQAGVDLRMFARDNDGRVRPLNDREWAYLKKHGVEAIAHGFSDPELAALEVFMKEAVDRQESRRLARR